MRERRNEPRTRQPAPGPAATPATTAHRLHDLQRSAGNQAVNALLRQGGGGADPLGGAAVAPDVEASIQGSSGQPLDDGTRSSMEGAFGADFSGVRVHTGAEAGTLSESLQAKAFTTGQDVFFGKGTYDPGSSSGQELLAHELTHVVQQTGDANRSIRRFVDVKTFEERTAEGTFTGKSTAQKTIAKLLGKYAGLAKKGTIPPDKRDQAIALLESMQAAADGWLEAHTGDDGAIDGKRQKRGAGMAWFLMTADAELKAMKAENAGPYADLDLPKAEGAESAAGAGGDSPYAPVDGLAKAGGAEGDSASAPLDGLAKAEGASAYAADGPYKGIDVPDVAGGEVEGGEQEAEEASSSSSALLPPEAIPVDPVGWKLIPDSYRPPAKDQSKYAKFAKDRDNATYGDEFTAGSNILRDQILPSVTNLVTDDAQWAGYAARLGGEGVVDPDVRARLAMKGFFGWSDADFDKQWTKIGKIGTAEEHPTVDSADETDREQYRLNMGTKITKAVDGAAFDTKGAFAKASGWNHAIFVMSPGGDFYAGSHKVGLFHHSSFLAGGKTSGAGDMVVTSGKLDDLSNHSGHYSPGADQMAQVMQELEACGINLGGVKYHHSHDPKKAFNRDWASAKEFLSTYLAGADAPEAEAESEEAGAPA